MPSAFLGKIKIGDLGLCRIYEEEQSYDDSSREVISNDPDTKVPVRQRKLKTTFVGGGTDAYLPPEHQTGTEAVDIYSAGLCLYEIWKFMKDLSDTQAYAEATDKQRSDWDEERFGNGRNGMPGRPEDGLYNRTQMWTNSTRAERAHVFQCLREGILAPARDSARLCPQQLTLLEKMTSLEPRMRPTADECLQELLNIEG